MKFVAVPDYQSSIRITLKRAITWTSPYEPQLSHSTGLPKPPGYNLQRSRVILIRVTLITGPPAKASHHVPHLKLCRNLSSRTIIEPKPPGAHHMLLGGTWLQTAWRASHTARRHAPVVPSQYRHRLAASPHRQAPCLVVAAWRLHALRQALCSRCDHCHWFIFLSAWRRERAPRRYTSSTMLLVFEHLNRSQGISEHTNHPSITQLWFTSHISIPNYITLI